MLAAYNNHPPVVDWLIASGAFTRASRLSARPLGGLN
jgi:hypothetical protein